jgi:dTDP-4-amino-4,6-dideoxygalactose transaminase
VAFSEGFFTEVPAFRQGPLYISPVNLESILFNAELYDNAADVASETVDLNGRKALMTKSATQALDIALAQLGLKSHQEIWILTTTNNSYISSCVTSTIEQHCRWNRDLSKNTAAILVNHEFGFCYPDLAQLKKFNLPIIEDAAYSMFSNNEEKSAGTIGDYVIYSLAKMFPVSSGGLLVSNGEVLPKSPLSNEEQRFFYNVFDHYYALKDTISNQRKTVYSWYCEAFSVLHLEPRFKLNEKDVPGAFLFKTPKQSLDKLKIQLQGLGIECSVFYGENTFYLPCHQNMNKQHVHYLAVLIKSLLK